MITLYDLVFDKDLRPSPFCWRAKLALKHKGLTWRDEPCGLGFQIVRASRPNTVEIGGVTIKPGSWIAADADGIIVSDGKVLGDGITQCVDCLGRCGI